MSANQNYIYQKTANGVEEIEARQVPMKPSIRRILILVDGKRTVGSMLPLFKSPEDAEAIFNELLSLGLIETLSGDPGTVSTAMHKQHAAELVEALNESTGQLAHIGRDPAQRFMDGQKFMNAAIRQHLGLKAIFFTLKIERCNNVEECLALLNEFEGALIRAMKDDIAAEAIRKEAERILTT